MRVLDFRFWIGGGIGGSTCGAVHVEAVHVEATEAVQLIDMERQGERRW